MFSLPVRVYYEDTDSGGVVYNANYLKFMERARTEWLRSLGFDQDELIRKEKIIFAVRTVTLEFLKPARFNDLLHVTVKLLGKARASLVFTQQVERVPSEKGNGKKKENTVLCTGQVKIACLNSDTFKPIRIPDFLLAEIACDN